MADATTTEDTGPVKFMEHMTSLDYIVRISPTQSRFDQQMKSGHIVGHKCPSCGRVYVPPKGYCPLCTVITTEKDEVEVKDTGVLTSFTVLTPIQYRGQKEREDYALASILLDGADSTVGQQRIAGCPLEEVRMGMRVKAEWRPEGEREGDAGGRGWGLGNAILHFVPTGEPDVDRDHYKEHVL
ncbi:MAG: Zn-ribbon domain-containing OB-fold protein [Actinobacteria bacterium]|nr:Zn-ribbon domain-containing OB-fold protein [Actinomycetota bacterium]